MHLVQNRLKVCECSLVVDVCRYVLTQNNCWLRFHLLLRKFSLNQNISRSQSEIFMSFIGRKVEHHSIHLQHSSVAFVSVIGETFVEANAHTI